MIIIVLFVLGIILALVAGYDQGKKSTVKMTEFKKQAEMLAIAQKTLEKIRREEIYMVARTFGKPCAYYAEDALAKMELIKERVC